MTGLRLTMNQTNYRLIHDRNGKCHYERIIRVPGEYDFGFRFLASKVTESVTDPRIHARYAWMQFLFSMLDKFYLYFYVNI